MDEGKQIILQMKYARIIEAMAHIAGISRESAMDVFYNSELMQLIQDGVADLHCRSDLYLAEEVLRE
ncbi:MAG: DUF3791 domain-containing protein, partial [Eggerthellaceae bacterium]|nr:DUF3791 domain-containing protein [Eggerthellaceae bacterium]